MNRRRFVMSAAAGAAGAALVSKGASALSIEPMTAETRAEIKAACNLREEQFHEKVLADVEASLNGKKLSKDQRQAIKEVLRCPSCGCSIASLSPADPPLF